MFDYDSTPNFKFLVLLHPGKLNVRPKWRQPKTFRNIFFDYPCIIWNGLVVTWRVFSNKQKADYEVRSRLVLIKIASETKRNLLRVWRQVGKNGSSLTSWYQQIRVVIWTYPTRRFCTTEFLHLLFPLSLKTKNWSGN